MQAVDLFDQEHFRHMTGGDRDLQVEILGLFRAQAQLWSRLLIPDAPVHTWRDAAHSLKGSARGLGLWALAEACETAEAMAKSGVREGRLVSQQLQRVHAALAEALDAIDLVLAEADIAAAPPAPRQAIAAAL